MDEKKFLKIVDIEGKEVEYEILSAFKLEKTDKNYIVYTDNNKDEEGSLNIYASIYYPKNNKLDSIETEEEWHEVERRLRNMQQEEVI